MEPIDQLKEFFGGGALTPVTIIVGLVVLYLAIKVASTIAKIAMFGAALVMFGGVALPWSGASTIEGEVAACAANQAADEVQGIQSILTKRVTVESLSADAACDSEGDGLSAGSAVVRLRTYYDVPFGRMTIGAATVG